MKRVALIGSSGGGTATLGHTDPVSFLQTIDAQLSLLGNSSNNKQPQARLVAALFVSLDGGKGMDGVDEQNASARLFQLSAVAPQQAQQQAQEHISQTMRQEEKESTTSFRHEVIALGSLAQVNAMVRQRQVTLIAQAIRDGHIDALICVSCHTGIFRETLQEAAKRGLVVTGSGGTSLAQMGSLYGIQLAGNAGGSVATTSLTKAVSFTHALAVAWGMPYQPWKDKSKNHLHDQQQRPSWTSVLNSCLPAFWGVCLTKKVLVILESLTAGGRAKSHPFLAESSWDWSFASLTATIVSLEHHTLPTVCAVMMALSFRRKDGLTSESSLVMAAILASSSCHDSVLTGLWAGYLVSAWSDQLLYKCIFFNIPATMTSLLVGGGLGGIVAVLVLPVALIVRHSTVLFRRFLAVVIQSQPWGIFVAAGIGWLSCYGSKVGWYHSIHLPLILIEMELGDASFLGAIDELTLVLVCSGTCAAMVMPVMRPKKSRSPSPADVLLCLRGLSINMTCGDFVEVCYPYMESSRLVNVGGYLASGSACAWLVWRGSDHTLEETARIPESMAYLPVPAAIAVAQPRHRAMLEASCVAFGLAFLFTFMARHTKR